jgi:hypothetical protein
MKPGSLALFAPLFVVAAVSLAHAQQPPPQPPPQPPVQAPLPPTPAALSVPDPLAGFRQGPRDLYQSPDGSDRFQHLSRYPVPPPIVFPPVYFPGPYYYPSPYHHYMAPGETSMAETYRMSMAENYLRRQRDAARDSARGTLLLEGVPDSAQVLVDGHYVGLASEFGAGGRLLSLNPGAHRIDLRASGYDAHTFNVMIEQHGTVRYRGEMQPVTTTAPTAVAATAPQRAPARSLYVIPNCYAGDKPPTGTLPKGCDLKNLQTRK